MGRSRSLIPDPQSVEWLAGDFAWRQGLQAVCHPGAKRIVESFISWLLESQGVRLSLREQPAFRPFDALIATPGAVPPHPGEGPYRAEGYSLHVSADGVAVAAGDRSGLSHAMQTLRQLTTNGSRVPSVRIDDWPELRIRGLHLDLKGLMPTFPYLCEMVTLAARYKINAFLIEYEDKFPYRRNPVLRSPEALTPEELSTFLGRCRDACIKAIPLLQSLGHVEYILRHEEYAHLREAGTLTQFCPLHPGSRALFEDMMGEILEYHADAAYFHIGADECRELGRCPRCAEVAAARGKAGLYVDHLNDSIRYVKKLGLTPIFWADAIRNERSPRIMDLVEPGGIPCDWLHDVGTDEVPFVYWGGGERISSRQWLDTDATKASSRDGLFIEDIPADELQAMRTYWDRGRFPLWNDSLPLLRLLAERGEPFLGADAAKGGTSPNHFFPQWGDAFGNVTLWGRRAKESGLLGVISTAFSRWNSLFNPSEPLEYGWYTIVASADYYWHPRAADRADFDRRFVDDFLDLPDATAANAMRALENPGTAMAAMQLLTPLQGRGARPLHLSYLLMAARVTLHQEEARSFLSELDGRVYQFEEGSSPLVERKSLARRLEALLKRQSELEREFESVLALTLRDADAHEVVLAQLRSLARRMLDYLSLLTPASPL